LLLALFLPAVQFVREAGRQTHCQNNLKQLATALLVHHEILGKFPSGGWGHEWIGVPERGAGMRQPGGWIYKILPQLEEYYLHDLGSGTNGSGAADFYSQRLQTAIPLFVCPSRRSCSAWPIADKYPWVYTPKPLGEVSKVARSDYAINAGTSHVFSFGGPKHLHQGDDMEFWLTTAPHPADFNGISHLRIGISINSIVDGTSKSYLMGEKHLDADSYTTGTSFGDNESLYAGYCTDLHRFAGVIENLKVHRPPYAAPLNDSARPETGPPRSIRFGSAHPTGVNMSFCDGSVTVIAYEVDPDIHFHAGHRADEDGPILPSD
jgi:prepilin-type processing-associated H-X9-DG protein